MISIIIPVYKVEAYLPQCLDSILAQTYTNYEVILVDDGSPDDSGAICDEYAEKDERIRVVHQKNSGVSVARNVGIEQANGEWITFIDSDDWVSPNYLKNFRLDDAEGLDLVIQGLEYYDHRKDCFFGAWSFRDCELRSEKFRLGFAENRLMHVGFPIGKAYIKKLLVQNKLRFDSRLSFHEDHIFVLDYYRLCRTICLVDATDYKYRCYHTGTSLSSKRHSWEKMNLAGDEMLKRFVAMRGRYFAEGSMEENKLYDFAYSCKVTAADTIILSDMSYKDKKEAFGRVISKRDIRQYSHPITLRGRIDTFLYSYLPFCFGYAYHHIIELLKRIRR